MSYFTTTVDMKFTIEVDSLTTLRMWVDILYTVHLNISSHTDETLLFGRGAFSASLQSKRINTKSSTKTKLVRDANQSPISLQAHMLMKEQRYKVELDVLFQGNISAILLEKNRR